MPHLRWLLLCGLIVPASLLAQSGYTPASAETVLETLPATDPALTDEIRRLQAAIAQRPEAVGARAQLAERYIALYRQTDDPRYNGYAQAVIAPWRDAADAPTQILLIRAHLNQQRHEFALARDDLQHALERDPRNAQAWLELSVVERVSGRLENAHKACAALLTLTETLISGTCLADIASLGGKAPEAFATLDRLLNADHDSGPPHLRRWALTIQGEIAWRIGEPALAAQAFDAALALAEANGQFDGYLLSVWADFMLAHGRTQAVNTRLKPYSQSDALLLRRAIAAKRLGLSSAADMADTLRRRFAASQQRGDEVHLREQARFALDIDDTPSEALWLAQRNWATQKEPADVILLLRSALSFNPSAADPVIAFVNETGLQDVRVDAFIQQLAESAAAA